MPAISERQKTGLLLAAGNAGSAGAAGIDKIGLGALIGLSDNWRVTAIWLPNICYGCNSITGKALLCLLSAPAPVYWRH